MPPLQFACCAQIRSVLIDLEVRFDVQLEADSFIGFFSPDKQSCRFRAVALFPLAMYCGMSPSPSHSISIVRITAAPAPAVPARNSDTEARV
jgi:hypothetical protein